MAHARGDVYRRLELLNDSIVPAQERARRAVDWTVTGDDGKRWGYEPGRIFLGDISIPYSLELPGNVVTAQRRRDWELAKRQSALAQVRAEASERAKAMRERKDTQRTGKRDDSR
jgi:hypothetical protein